MNHRGGLLIFPRSALASWHVCFGSHATRRLDTMVYIVKATDLFQDHVIIKNLSPDVLRPKANTLVFDVDQIAYKFYVISYYTSVYDVEMTAWLTAKH